MIFRQRFLEMIGRGQLTLAFRRWTRPSVKSGGTLLTSAGLLRIESVKKIAYDDISDKDVADAGYNDRSELDRDLRYKSDGDLYRIAFVREGNDPRIKLRENDKLPDEEFAKIAGKLKRIDSGGAIKDWTLRVLKAIEENPGLRALDLAKMLGYEKDWLKPNIRKLKNLGLTVSLEVGYEISPRGRAFIERWQR